jgi:hypothetical protein
MFAKGNCFWIETNPDEEGRPQGHFFVLICRCVDGRIVIVNVDKTKGKKKYDRTTILKSGEGHSFIKEESFVNYDEAEVTDIGSLQEKINDKTAKHKDGLMNPSVVDKICDGVLKSEFSNYEVREIFEDLLYASMKTKH